MLMPLLVRLTDPQVEMADGVVSQVPDAVDDGSRILEQERAAGLPIHEEVLLPDLAIEPLRRNVELGSQLGDAEEAGIVVPAGTLLGHLEPGTEADPLDRKSTRLNSSHMSISYAVFCLKKKKKTYFIGSVTFNHLKLPHLC